MRLLISTIRMAIGMAWSAIFRTRLFGGNSTGSSAAASLPKQIVPSDSALRRIRSQDVYSDGRIKKAAFMPSSNGKDATGLSVSIVDGEHVELHRAKFEQPGKATAALLVSAVLNLGLDVEAAPEPEDPRHALITGIPDRTLGDAERLEAERHAEQLAKRASVYRFP
jgi:hypothetical protein